MEVSRRRVLQKHLEPARPLRRCIHADIYLPVHPAAHSQLFMNEETNIGVEQLYKIVNLQKEKKDRISYTRDFLIALACCPEAKKKPDFLPEHPIVLTEARDPKHLRLHEMRMTGGKDEMAAEGLHSP